MNKKLITILILSVCLLAANSQAVQYDNAWFSKEQRAHTVNVPVKAIVFDVDSDKVIVVTGTSDKDTFIHYYNSAGNEINSPLLFDTVFTKSKKYSPDVTIKIIEIK